MHVLYVCERETVCVCVFEREDVCVYVSLRERESDRERVLFCLVNFLAILAAKEVVGTYINIYINIYIFIN